MEIFLEILKLLPEIVSAASAVVAFVLLIVKAVKDKNWKLITEIAKQVMADVEEFAKLHPEMTSEDKLNMALEGIKTAMTAAGIKFDEKVIKKLIDYISEMCKWSKKVNTVEVKATAKKAAK